MAVQKVLRMGHPLLNQCAKAVENFNNTELSQLILDMKDTMAELKGAGLAAPQIGASVRIVIFGVEKNPRYPDVESVPETVLINPKITVLDSTEEESWEGCLSIPYMRGLVPRYKSINYQGYNEKGERIERVAHDFHARVVQHEIDHLDGILYPQRIENMQNFGFEDEFFPQNNYKDKL